MRCRHTVPEWHRYVAAGENAVPIFAACRLLVKEGEQTRDARSIACAYWGHQRDCPLYDGPETISTPRPHGVAGISDGDVAAGSERAWPVRAPGSSDGQRVLLIVLAASSVALLGWLVGLSVAALSGMTLSTSYWWVSLIGGTLSLITHTLTCLRLWVRG
jgi:hypothetical protein